MDIKKEVVENTNTLSLEDLCSADQQKSDTNFTGRSITPPAGVLPPWDFSPVIPNGPNAASVNMKTLHRSESQPMSTPECEYYSNIVSQENGSQNSLTSATSMHEWNQNYPWDYYNNYTTSHATHSPYKMNSTADNIGSNFYRSTCTTSANSIPPFTVCNVQQYDMELIRCSTPELITALAAIQPDKEHIETCDNSHSTNFTAHQMASYSCHESVENNINDNVSVVKEHGTSMFMHLAQRYQDSGYSSDLCMSPVYPYDAKSHYSMKDNFRYGSDDEQSMYLHNDVNLAQYVPKFNLCKSSSTCLPTNSENYPLHEKQIQSSDISSSNYASSVVAHRVTHKIAAKPLPPVSTFKPQAVKKSTVCERPSKKRANPSNSSVSSKDDKKRHNQPLNLQATETMMKWYEAHRENPYPTKLEKEKMAAEGGVTVTQVKSWFANKRNRNNNTRPKVQKRQMTEKLLDICHELARDAQCPSMNNADIIQKLSSIITTPTSADEDL